MSYKDKLGNELDSMTQNIGLDEVNSSFLDFRQVMGKSDPLCDFIYSKIEEAKIGQKEIVLIDNSSVELTIAATLGAIKAGKAIGYISSEFPENYFKQIVKTIDSSGIFVTQKNNLRPSGYRVFQVDINKEKSPGILNPDWEIDNKFIFTSGGFSKIEKSKERLLHWLNFAIETLKIDFNNTLYLLSNNQFAGFPLWLANVKSGGSFSFVNPYNEFAINSKLFKDYNSIVCPLDVLYEIQTKCKYADVFPHDLKNVITFGESIFPLVELKQYFKQNNIKWFNFYGFPEISFITTLYQDAVKNELLHIGLPVSDTQAYILDKNNKILPRQIKGKLHLQGKGVCDSYIFNNYREEETVVSSDIPEKSLRSTNFEAFWTSEWRIGFSNHLKNNVVINGISVNIKHIESVLINHKQISDCVITEKNGQLNIYIVTNSFISVSNIESYLRRFFPVDIFPINIIELGFIEYGPDGKPDLSQLKSLHFHGNIVLDGIKSKLVKELKVKNDDLAIITNEFIQKPKPWHIHDLNLSFLPKDNKENKKTTKRKNDKNVNDSLSDALVYGGDLIFDEKDPLNLIQAIQRCVKKYPNGDVIDIDKKGKENRITYKEMYENALSAANGLKKKGALPNDKVILHIEGAIDYFISFWACIFNGAIPVPIGIPAVYGENNETQALLNIWEMLDKPMIISNKSLVEEQSQYFKGKQTVFIENILNETPFSEGDLYHPKSEEIAIILFTSGSTGKPKGVTQSHKTILSRQKSAIDFYGLNNTEISLNWFPIEHVVGILMFHIKEIYLGCKQIHIKPQYVLSNPLLWMDLAHKYKVTMTWAPNFAFGLILDSLKNNQDNSWDLSSIKLIVNAGETINASICKRFLKELGKYYLNENVIKSEWGMSETCSCVLGLNEFNSDENTGCFSVDKNTLGEIIEFTEDQNNAIKFADLGIPYKGTSFRIVDSNNNLLKERQIGQLQVKGATVTPGYYNNPKVNKETFVGDGWFDTGDLGFIYNGHVTFTGRLKDVIIINGINYNNNEIEAMIEKLDGVFPSFTIAVSSYDSDEKEDKLLIFYCSELDSEEDLIKQIAEIKNHVGNTFGITPKMVLPVTKDQIPKTSIGKLQRSKIKKRYEEKEFDNIIRKLDIIAENENTLPKWFFNTSWKKLSKELPHFNYHSIIADIIFLDFRNEHSEWINNFEWNNGKTYRICYSDDYKSDKGLVFNINPRKPEHFQQFFNETGIKGFCIIINLSLLDKYNGNLDINIIDKFNQEVIGATQNIYKNIEELGISEVSLYFLTNNLYAVAPNDNVHPLKGLVVGMVKCLISEGNNITPYILDLDPEGNGIPSIIKSEIFSFRKSSEVAYRNEQRWVPQLKPLNLINADTKVPIKDESVYLVTGGLGGIGIFICQWLVKEYNSKIIIVGRECIYNNKDGEKFQDFQKLKDISDNIVYMDGDISEKSFIDEVFTKSGNIFNQNVEGVFHLAGLGKMEEHYDDLNSHFFTNENLKYFKELQKAKILGTLFLHEKLAENKKSLFVSFSSAMTKFGATTFTAYASSNSFLDSFYHYRKNLGYTNTFCLNWSTWKNIGMSKSSLSNDNVNSHYQNITLQKGLMSLKACMRSTGDHIFIGINNIGTSKFPSTNLKSRRRQKINVFIKEKIETKIVKDWIFKSLNTLSEEQDTLLRIIPVEKIPKDNDSIDYLRLNELMSVNKELIQDSSVPETNLEIALYEIWKQVLNHEIDFGINSPFYEIGGNSIKLMQILSLIHENLGYHITTKDFANNNTIKLLAQHCKSEGNRIINYEYPKSDPDPVNINKPFRLNEVQMAYFVGRESNLDLGGVSTHIYSEIEMVIDIPRLNESLNKVIKRHGMLRAIINKDGTQQILPDKLNYTIKYKDLSNLNNNEKCVYIDEMRQRLSHRIFDTSEWPLFEFEALKIEEDGLCHIGISIDSIIMDAGSIQILFNEVFQYYENPELNLPELKYSFRDYMISIEELKKSPIYKRDKEYWMGRLAGFPSSPNLPLKKQFSEIKSPIFKRKQKVLTYNDWNKIKNVAKKFNVTPTALFCTLYSKTLSLWSNQKDIALNLTMFNRIPFHKDVNNTIGDFTSLTLLGIQDLNTKSFIDEVKGVQKLIYDAIEHRHFDGVEFIREIRSYNNSSSAALMPVVFTSVLIDDGVENGKEFKQEKIYFNEQEQSTIAVSQTSQAFLDHGVGIVKDKLFITWDYIEELFDEQQIDEMFTYYVNSIENLIDSKKDKICSSINLLNKRVADYNNTSEMFEIQTLYQLFKFQFEINPDCLAIEDGMQCYTYAELDSIVNQVANYLKDLGIGRQDMVGIITTPSIYTIAGILGILKLGGVYVPIDENYPQKRKEYIIKDSNCSVVIDSGRLESILEKYSGKYIGNSHKDVDDIAYVIYTSGTTGYPKGVVISHKQAVNTILEINRKFKVSKQDKIASISSYGFDLSVYDIFGALSSGASIRVVKDTKKPENLLDLINNDGVTIWNTVPSFMGVLLQTNYEKIKKGSKLRLVLLSGDWIPVELPKQIHKVFDRAELVSLGGATEASIWSIYYPVKEISAEWKSIPYGYPLSNQKMYVLNFNRELCQVGVPGDIYIGGDGVAEGYLNMVEKTNQVFINNSPYGRIYETGDLGCFHKEDYISIIGRKDNQVKVRGHRIELNGITSQLERIRIVKGAVVTVEVKNGEQYLIAFIILQDTKKDEKESLNAIKTELGEYLPEYMVPMNIFIVSEFPLTPNGKVDHGKLKTLYNDIQDIYSPPQTETQKKLISIWAEVLQMEENEIGINDNFLQIGGHSLKAMVLISKIKDVLRIEVPLVEIFKNLTVHELAKFIDNQEENITKNIVPSEKREFYSVSSAQKRLFFIEQLENISTTYNNLTVIGISGQFDKIKFKRAVNQLITRHEVFRTSFHFRNNEIYQHVNDNIKIDIEEVYFDELDNKNILNFISSYKKPFDLSKAPLIRIGLINISNHKFYFISDIHHIICDGTSIEIIKEEFIKLYLGMDLPPVKLHYKDYSVWQNIKMHRFEEGKQFDYWLERLGGELPKLNLPTDFIRPEVFDFKGDNYTYMLTDNEAKNIKSFCKDNDVTLFMYVLSILNVILYRYSGDEDIIIGAGIFGRSSQQLSNMIGMFVNTLPIRSLPNGNKSFEDFLKEVKKNSIEAFENKDVQLEQIIEGLQVERDLSRNTLFDVLLIVQNYELAKTVDIKKNNIQFNVEELKRLNSKFDLSFRIQEIGNELIVDVEYATSLFKEETVSKLVESLIKVSEQVISNKNMRICDVSIESDIELAEKQSFDQDFNF